LDVESLRYRYLRHVVMPLLRCAGFRATSALARRLVRGYQHLNPPGRAIAPTRLRAALGSTVDADDIHTLVDHVYDHWARFWAEAVFLPQRLAGRRWRQYVNIENEIPPAPSGRAHLFATAYYGNPAAAACALARLLGSLHVIVDFAAHPALSTWQATLRRAQGISLIERRDAHRSLPDVLGRGSAVLMVCDHHRPRGPAVESDFLGHTWRFYPTLGRLARWFNAPITTVTCRRHTHRFGFTLTAHDHIDPPQNAVSADDAIRRAMRSLEAAILAHPAQYLWTLPGPMAANPGAQRRPSGLMAVRSTGRETGSASYQTARQTASASRSTSAADRTTAGPAAEAAPSPTA